MYLDIEPRAVLCRAVLVTREGGVLSDKQERDYENSIQRHVGIKRLALMINRYIICIY